MAEEKKQSFPRMSVSHWWALRDKFKQTIPGTVTENYIATILNMSTNSARTNVLPPLRQIGIIGEDGKPNDISKRWRDDTQYPAVCQEIIKNVYPSELIDAIPDPENNKDAAERWFAHTTGVGSVAVKKMVAFYSLLCQADPSKSLKETKQKPTKTKKSVKNDNKSAPPPKTENITESKSKTLDSQTKTKYPQISINLQIHISSDASTEQIDQIFESMAKHIYKEGN